MNEIYKAILAIILTSSILILTALVAHPFIPSLIWAAVIAMTTYPLYLRWKRLLGPHIQLAAFSFTLILSLLFLLPLSWLLGLLFKELQVFIVYLQSVNQNGAPTPTFLNQIPLVGHELTQYWLENIAPPGSVRHLLSNLHISLAPTSYYIKQIGANLVHRGFQLGFTMLTLFFFYRDSEILLRQINRVGAYTFGEERWHRYANRLPQALRSTVNGTIFVGLGVGVLMGLCYAIVGLPGPTLAGFITALAAMIPFVVPVVFLVIALMLFSTGHLVGALVVAFWGTLVMFIADHFIKPFMIGGAIELPFLAVLFGILGGVEEFGLLGLFLGPIIMVLFMTLWQESYRLSQGYPS